MQHPENLSCDQRPALAPSTCWAPCLRFYDVVCRHVIDPVTVRDYLPADMMRIIVLIKKGWWLGTHWKVLNPNGQPGRFNAISFHGPKGEFQPHAPAEVLAMTRSQMVDFLLPNSVLSKP